MKQSFNKLLTATACALVFGCSGAKTSSGEISAPLELAQLMENTFQTAADDTESNFTDRRVIVSADGLSGTWVYLQLNTGAEKKLYRQRLFNLTMSDDGERVVQTTYELKAPEKYVDAWTNPKLLNALTTDDFDPYFTTGCEQHWQKNEAGTWSGYVDPKLCVITSKRRGKQIRIESEGQLSADMYRTNERGYDMDMTFLWGTKPGEYISMFPVIN